MTERVNPLPGKPFGRSFFPQEAKARNTVTQVVYEEAESMHRLALSLE